jgi:hypothetical protein
MQMRHISKCLNSKLSKICAQAIKLEELSDLVLTHLPPDLRAHCQVGSFQAGKLIIVATNSNWATELRYFAPELRDSLRTKAALPQLVSIEIKINYLQNK